VDEPNTDIEVFIIVRIGKQDIHDALWFEVIDKDKEEILKKVQLAKEYYGQSD
jgi:hypothetical protein